MREAPRGDFNGDYLGCPQAPLALNVRLIGAGRLLRASNDCNAGQAAFHLIEQPIEGI
jgi:hypothetical protein